MPEKLKVHKISLKDFEIMQTLGIGSFGVVKLIRNKVNKKYYALKMLKKEDLIKLKQIDHVKSEITVLSMLNYNLFVKFYGID